MAELKFDIGAIVDITLAVSEKVRAKYDLELELVNDELAEANAEIERLQAKVEAMELLGDFEAIQADIDKLTEQKDRQAKTIQELMEKLEAADMRADNAILESVDAGAVAKQKEEIRRLETLNAQLSEKLRSAQDWIQRQNSKIAKLETQPPAEPEWIRPTDDEPQDGVDVLVTTVRGSIVIARLTSGGWKNKVTGAILTDPRAWMALPEAYEEA